MLYSWWELDGCLFPCTVTVPSPPGARYIGHTVCRTLEEELLVAGFCRWQADELPDEPLADSTIPS